MTPTPYEWPTPPDEEFCASCGTPIGSGDRWCPSCGAFAPPGDPDEPAFAGIDPGLLAHTPTPGFAASYGALLLRLAPWLALGALAWWAAFQGIDLLRGAWWPR